MFQEAKDILGDRLLNNPSTNEQFEFKCLKCDSIHKAKKRAVVKNEGICSNCIRGKGYSGTTDSERKFTQKIGTKEIEDALATTGSKLLSPYRNNKTKIRILCGGCNEEKEGVWQNLKNSNVCGKCSKRSVGLKSAVKYITDRGATYDGCVWTDRLYLVKYICLCGEKDSITWSNRGDVNLILTCKKCRAEGNRLSYDECEERFMENGFVLLTLKEEYQGSTSDLKAICPCGSETRTRLNEVVRGRMCRKCQVERTKDTVQEKYGVNNVAQTESSKKKISRKVKIARSKPEVNEKIYTTCLARYGKKAAFLTDENDEKKRKALIEKCGTLYPLKLRSVQRKIERVNLERYGVRRPLQSREIHEKIIKTMQKKYGVDYAFENSEIFMKAIKAIGSLHCYKFDCGSELLVQGYECFMLRDLEKRGYGYDTVKVNRNEMPDIRYNYQGKKRRYYPDIMLKGKLIEVKCNWTYLLDPNRNKAKWDATVEQGHKLFIAFYDSLHRRVKFFKWNVGTIINILHHPKHRSSYKIELNET